MPFIHWQKTTRYYQAEIRADLFSPAVLVLSWGGIGRRPHHRVTCAYNTRDEAEAALRAVASRRQRRGYQLVYEVSR